MDCTFPDDRITMNNYTRSKTGTFIVGSIRAGLTPVPCLRSLAFGRSSP